MIMNKYVKEFLLRGAMFSGLGPILAGIVYLCISFSIDQFTLTAQQVLLAIVSTYFLAFLQAGASVFNQIDHWPVLKSTFFHFVTIYVAYVGCYLVNSWIPFDATVVAIFTAIFVVIYLVIWLVVYFSVKATCKKFNRKLV